jgi:hypothetical protein
MAHVAGDDAPTVADVPVGNEVLAPCSARAARRG